MKNVRFLFVIILFLTGLQVDGMESFENEQEISIYTIDKGNCYIRAGACGNFSCFKSLRIKSDTVSRLN